VTERRTREDIDRLADALTTVLADLGAGEGGIRAAGRGGEPGVAGDSRADGDGVDR
jgi:hypothetical protein